MEQRKPQWLGNIFKKKITNEKAEQINKIVDDPENDIEQVMSKIDQIETKIKFKAFGKAKPKSRNICKGVKTKKTQDEEDNDIKQREIEKVEKHIEEIKAKNHGRAGNVFRIRKAIAGPRKAGQEASSIKDPFTGELHVDSDAIKETTLAYCVRNLKGNSPEDVKQRKRDQLQKMDNEYEDLEIDHEDFKDVLKKFSKKPTKTYDFLLKAGPSYQNAIFKLCKRMIDNEEIPESFHKTTLVMIWKMK